MESIWKWFALGRYLFNSQVVWATFFMDAFFIPGQLWKLQML
jgi:hypothetical protein